MWEFFYPRGGWTRAFHYVRHRVRRLPDSPERISRGIFAGVLVSFTPLFGLHFLTAAIIARIMHGNILAAIMATFFGNPISFPIIAASSLKLGHWLLGTTFDGVGSHTIMGNVANVWSELNHNFWAVFTDDVANWANLFVFYDEVFLPYIVGGLIIGSPVALICYYVSHPLIAIYQNRRKGRLKAKFAERRTKKAAKKSDAGQPGE
jgi:uncharacterized protein (DUF2062 family)